MRRDVPNSGAALFLRDHLVGDAPRVRRVAGARIRSADAAARGSQARDPECTVRGLITNLIDEFVGVDAHRHHRAEAEVGGTAQIVIDALPRVVLAVEREARLIAHVAVRADQRRHDGLAGKVDACHIGRDVELPNRAKLRDHAAIDHECRLLDWRRSVAGNQ